MEGRNDGVDVCMKRWQIMDEMHTMAKLLLDCVEYILNWPINWVIGSTVDNAMASSDNHLRNDWVVVSAKVVHEKASAVLSSSRPNIVQNILDKVDEELEICPRTQRKFPPSAIDCDMAHLQWPLRKSSSWSGRTDQLLGNPFQWHTCPTYDLQTPASSRSM